jgi:hypothetical protein
LGKRSALWSKAKIAAETEHAVQDEAEGAPAVTAPQSNDIAQISFPDDPITDLNFYVAKLRHVLNDSQPI